MPAPAKLRDPNRPMDRTDPDNREWLKSIDRDYNRLRVTIESNLKAPRIVRRLALAWLGRTYRYLKTHA